MVNKKTTNVKKADSFNTERTRAMLLCCLLGVFGIHKFYQGKKAQGFLYLILGLTIVGLLITIILSFIDIIKMTIRKDNSDKEFIVGLILCLITPHGIVFNKIMKTADQRYGKEITKFQKDKDENNIPKIYPIETQINK